MKQTSIGDLRHDGNVLSGSRIRVVLYSVLVAVCGYVGLAIWSGWQDISNAVKNVGLGGLAIAAGLSLLNFGSRFCRWNKYLQAMGHSVPWWPSLKIYCAGFAMTMTPGRAGEALRGVLLKNWGIPYPSSFAAMFSERLSDLSAVIFLSLVGATFSEAPRLPVVVAASALVLGLLIISNQKILVRFHLATSDRSRGLIVLHHLFSILLESRRCHTPRLLATATAFSLTAWTAQAFTFHLILQWLGLDVPISFSVFVFSISLLAGAISFMPGGLGGVEASMTALLIWNGAGTAEAISATVLFRLVTLWFAVSLGMMALGLEVRSNGVSRRPLQPG